MKQVNWSALQSRINDQLTTLLEQEKACGEPLFGALCYAMLAPGKRIRPIFTIETARIFGASEQASLRAACSIEALHCYSLVHDDLPAMDDDDMRRGRATCHIAYDEATAILVGDALQALAYQWIAEDPLLNSTQQSSLMHLLAVSTGPRGMVGGQALDIASENQSISIDTLEQLHRLKTGALLDASIKAGAIVAGVSDGNTLQALSEYALAIGLAFQIQDDILDVTSTTEALGKAAGADEQLNKATYPRLIGLEASQEKLRELNVLAKTALTRISGIDTLALRSLSEFLVYREH